MIKLIIFKELKVFAKSARTWSRAGGTGFVRSASYVGRKSVDRCLVSNFPCWPTLHQIFASADRLVCCTPQQLITMQTYQRVKASSSNGSGSSNHS
jgi:hypothetical protein